MLCPRDAMRIGMRMYLSIPIFDVLKCRFNDFVMVCLLNGRCLHFQTLFRACFVNAFAIWMAMVFQLFVKYCFSVWIRHISDHPLYIEAFSGSFCCHGFSLFNGLLCRTTGPFAFTLMKSLIWNEECKGMDSQCSMRGRVGSCVLYNSLNWWFISWQWISVITLLPFLISSKTPLVDKFAENKIAFVIEKFFFNWGIKKSTCFSCGQSIRRRIN